MRPRTKRLVSILCALAMLFSVLPAATFAADEEAIDGVNVYAVDGDTQIKEIMPIGVQGVMPLADTGITAGGWFETIYAELPDVAPSAVTEVSWSGTATGSLDAAKDIPFLVRSDGDKGTRIDVPGVKAGTYTLTVKADKDYTAEVEVLEYDRSGYAHWNYTEGVGAYKDDGTLKPNAIVLYVTEETKNTVKLEYKGKTVIGIGNILNSVGADAGDPAHPGMCKRTSGTKTYWGIANSNQGILADLAKDNVPLVVRIIGDVKSVHPFPKGELPADFKGIVGLTAYDAWDYGGSEKDQGNMARMQNCKNITIEGVGTDAVMNGWGVHFMASSSTPTYGKNFEVRNITFKNVPEDCIGMEGVQSGSNLTAPIEHGWVHNCSFIAPTISPSTESDKGGGDGACDFKRGQYFTMSYCYYEGYHKTNLVGSSDTSLQYNITWHHNYYRGCDSRGPLGRQANMHIYNCIFEAQTSKTMDVRANCYIFSEYNLFDKSKNPVTIKSGAVKSFGDVFTACTGDQMATIVTDKSQPVSSANKYANFDTDPNSYIAKKDYNLDESTMEAKKKIMAYTGVMKKADDMKDPEDVNTSILREDRIPQNYVDLDSRNKVELTLNKAWAGSSTSFEKENILFNIGKTPADYLTLGGKNSQGQDIVFKVKYDVYISMEAAGKVDPALVNVDGETIFTGSDLSEKLPAGVYIIQSSIYDVGTSTYKEAGIAKLSIEKAGDVPTLVDPKPADPKPELPPSGGGTTPDNPDNPGDDDGPGNANPTPGGAPSEGSYVHNFTENGKASDFYTITGNISSSKGKVNYNGLELTDCLKMESATKITFTAPEAGTLTLVFVENSPTFKLDGAKITGSSQAVTVTVTKGNHEITKADGHNLFYMFYTPDSAKAHTHSWSAWAYDEEDIPTCTDPGLELRECSECGETEMREVPALGHDFHDGVCDRCGLTEAEAPVVVKKDALNAAIANANTLAGSVVVDTAAANVPEGTQWVTQADKNTFTAAIAAAQAVYSKADATQDEVDAAVTALTSAVESFMSKWQAGSKKVDTVPTNKVYILDANDLTVTDNKATLSGQKWGTEDFYTVCSVEAGKPFTPAKNTSFDDHTWDKTITLGGAYSYNKGDVKAALKFTTTNSATVKVWWENANTTEVRNLAIFGSNGSQIKASSASTGNGAIQDVFEYELSAAGTYYLGSTKSSVNIYRVEVSVAPEKTDVPVPGDKTALNAAIEAAKANMDSVEVSDDGKDVSTSDQWVTSSDKSAYNIAILAAQAVANNAFATQKELDAAVSALADATAKFDAAKKAGTKTGGSSGNTPGTTPEGPSGSGGSGGGGGGGGGGGAAPTTSGNKTTITTVGEDVKGEVKPTVDGASAKADVSDKDMSNLVGQAARKNSGNIIVSTDVPDDVTDVTITVSTEALEDMAKKTDANLVVESDLGSVKFPADVVEDLGKGSGLLAVEIEKTADGLDVEIRSGGKRIEYLEGITVVAPVEGEGSVAVIVHADGTETILKKSYVDDGKLHAMVDGSGLIKLVNNAKSFTDIADSWAKDAIDFATSRELFNGVGDGTVFAPNQSMTRSMLVTVLYRLEGAKTSEKSAFTDVPADTWYSEAVAWGNAAGIVTGTPSGFNPDDDITREQLATILYRYATKLCGAHEVEGDSKALESYPDAATVSDYAAEAMTWAVNEGIIGGRGDGTLAPAGFASRAEVSTMLMRFIKAII